MAGKILPDDLWDEIEHLFPEHQPSPDGGRPWAPNRAALAVIVFVLKTGLAWQDVPLELGCSGKTAKRRLEEWTAAGVWRRVHAYLLAKLRGADQIDWSRSLLDSSHVKAPQGGEKSALARWIGGGAAANTTC
jgi:transposase